MRAPFVSLSLAALAACATEPNNVRVVPLGVSWLEWPAEILSSELLEVRQSGYLPACGSRFRPAYHADLSTVTMEPFALVPDPPPCVNVVQGLFGATVRVRTPGDTSAVRTFEMRAATYEYPTGIVVRTFGEAVARPDSIQTRRRNAVGHAVAARDQAGCLRVYPVARYTALAYPLENPPDTTSDWTAFVQGYVYEVATPVCGETTVFHLVSRE